MEEVALAARTLFAHGAYAEAAPLFAQLAQARPDQAAAQYHWGVVLAKLEDFEAALGRFRCAIALDPNFAAAYTNIGVCLNALNRVPLARQAFALARHIAPEDPVPVLNEGIAALTMGDYDSGWRDFAARWRLPAYARFQRSFPQPPWQGEPLQGKRIFLYAEQGFGDTIQMIRFAPGLMARGASVCVEVQPALTDLIARNLKGATIISQGAPVPAFDFHCALMDVPRALTISLENLPAPERYLAADPARGERFKRGTMAQKRIGLCWTGRVQHENNANRSLSLTNLAPLWCYTEVEWISLQRLVPDADRAALTASPLQDWGSDFMDFSATAAAIEALDLVITVDTAIAHLAGALGKEVWILLPFAGDWRWLMNRTDSPWYPTARLFRQEKRGTWDSVIQAVAEVLRLNNV